MVESVPDIVLITDRIGPVQLAELVERFFVDMVKYVVDVERGIAAVGGELHADAEQLLLEGGSRQEDLWGANYYPDRGPDGCVEFTSLINSNYTLEQKVSLVECLWRIAYADETLHKYEEHLVRKIADLLYVPHSAFIAAKLSARGDS